MFDDSLHNQSLIKLAEEARKVNEVLRPLYEAQDRAWNSIPLTTREQLAHIAEENKLYKNFAAAGLESTDLIDDYIPWSEHLASEVYKQDSVKEVLHELFKKTHNSVTLSDQSEFITDFAKRAQEANETIAMLGRPLSELTRDAIEWSTFQLAEQMRSSELNELARDILERTAQQEINVAETLSQLESAETSDDDHRVAQIEAFSGILYRYLVTQTINRLSQRHNGPVAWIVVFFILEHIMEIVINVVVGVICTNINNDTLCHFSENLEFFLEQHINEPDSAIPTPPRPDVAET